MAAADRPAGAASLAAAIVLHLGVFAALLLTAKPTVIPMGSAVPVTIVSEAPAASAPKADPAPEAKPALSEAPVVEARPPEPAPAPPPRPTPAPPKPPRQAPPKPAPKPKPALAKPIPKPTPAQPAKPLAKTAKPDQHARTALDLDALQASLATSTHQTVARPSSAPRGPTRAQTAPETGPVPGVSRADQAGLSQLLNRLWNPNCSVEGGDAVLVSVTFTVGYDGRLIGRVSAGGRENSSDPVVQAAARRALDAVHAVEPYQPVYRGAPFRINFDAKKACAGR